MSDFVYHDLSSEQKQHLRQKWARVQFRYWESWVGVFAIVLLTIMGCAIADYFYEHYLGNGETGQNASRSIPSRYAFVVGAVIGGMIGTLFIIL